MWFFTHKSSRTSDGNTPRPRCRLHLEAMEDRSVPSAGLLDPTFGSDGVVTTAINRNNPGSAAAAVLQPDGKILAVGGPNFSVVRYNPNGSLDTSFGSGGKVTTSSGNLGQANAAALYPPGTANAGKIVLAGNASTSSKGHLYLDSALVRYNVNGTLDTSFGNKGKVVTDLGGDTEALHGVAIQSDGKIVVAGMTYSSTNDYQFALARYNVNGTLDTSFGTGGKVLTKLTSGTAELNAIAIDPAGKIVVVGEAQTSSPYSHLEIVVARYTSDGRLDTNSATGFGPLDPVLGTRSGFASPYASGDDYGLALALQPDAKIVVSGLNTNGGDHFVLARFNPDGSADGSFGGAGKVETQVAGDWASALVIQSNGKIMAAGASNVNYSITGLALVRYNVDGSLDDGSTDDSTPGDSFGIGGTSFTHIGTGGNTIGALALQPDGKLIAVGTSEFGFTVARYLTAEPHIGTFTASSYSVPPGTSVTLTAANIADANPGSTVTQVTFYYFDANGDKVSVTGFQTSPGVWTASLDTSGWSGHYTLYAQAQDSYGILGDPLGIDLEVI